MSLPPLNALRAFEAIARTGSFRAAAEALHVTQPAISHQIRNLEDWLGAPLFDRSGRQPRLLPRGQALARDLTLAFGSIEAACQRAQPPSEALVVAAIPSVALCWLIPRLPRFRARHPRISLRIVYAHHAHSVDFRDADLAFTFAAAPPGPNAARFLPGASVPVCSPALAAPSSPEAMLQAGLLHDTDQGGWRDWLARAGLAAPADLPGPVFEDFNLLRAAALSGQGVALAAQAMIGEDLAENRLILLSDITVKDEFSYYLAWADGAGGRKESAIRLFREWALAEAAGADP